MKKKQYYTNHCFASYLSLWSWLSKLVFCYFSFSGPYFFTVTN